MQTKSLTRNARMLGVGLSVAATIGGCTSDSDGDVEIPGVNSPVTQGSPSTVGAPDTTTPPLDTAPNNTTPSSAAPAPSEAPAASSSLPQESVPATPAPATTAAIVYYRQGDEAPEIGIMQLKLITLGYLAQGSSTGVFDAATDAALRQFQKDYALGVDGVFGPLTNRSLTAAANSVDLEPA
jgi:hypothetical protein